jgi:lipid-binding SYLF domain-containing protein
MTSIHRSTGFFRYSSWLLAVAALLAASGLRAESGGKYLARFETCEAIIREFQDDPQIAIPPVVLKSARALVIVNQIQGGLVLGVQYGYGTMLVRRADGSWSIPVLVKVGGAGFGLQLGGQRAESIYVFTEETAPRIIFDKRFNIDIDARAVAGPHAYEPEKLTPEVLAYPVLVYGRGQGYYAGVAVTAGWIDRHDAVNQAYYKTPYSTPELLYGNDVAPTAGVRPLMDFVTQISH